MAEVIVIGGGIYGASVAYRLAQAGAKVTLVEAGTLARGTSGASFAWINANDKPPFEYHLLNVSGMGEHQFLEHEFGAAPWLHRSGNIEWGRGESDRARLRAKVDRLRAWGYQAELLTAAQLREIEPDLVLDSDVEEVAFYPQEGYVDVPLLVGTLVAAARAAGAVIRTNCRVVTIAQSGGRVTGVATAAGERLAADVVVSCTGRWSDQTAALVGVRLPLTPTVGLLAISAPSLVRLRAVVHSPGVNLRPDGAGRIMMRGYRFDAMVQAEMPVAPPPSVCNEILAEAVKILPGLAGTPIEAARIGVRPIPADTYPVVGPVPGIEGFYLVCSHSGVTLGPLVGRLVAREIMAGDVDPRLAPFRPARLITSATPA